MNGSQRADISIRAAQPADAARVAEIFNQSIEDRVATFETRTATPEDAARWIGDDVVIVAEASPAAATSLAAGKVLAWARASPYSDRHHYYDGVREATLYVDRCARRSGIGHALLDALAGAASGDGAHKLVGKIFTSNEPSIALVKGLGWTEVGVHKRHGRLDGEWKDVLVVERLLVEDAETGP